MIIESKRYICWWAEFDYRLWGIIEIFPEDWEKAWGRESGLGPGYEWREVTYQEARQIADPSDRAHWDSARVTRSLLGLGKS